MRILSFGSGIIVYDDLSILSTDNYTHPLSGHILSELLCLGLDVLDGTSHVESRLGEGVMGSRKDLLE